MGKFRIKIAASWFSNDYFVLKYSTNGIFWKTIKCYEYYNFEGWAYMVDLTINFKNVKNILNDFKTLDDVKNFELEQKQKVIKKNNEIEKQNIIHKKERDAVYKQFS